MTPDRLASIPLYGRAFDLETHPVTPGLAAPPPVCGSVGWLDAAGVLQGCLLDKEQAYQALVAMLDDDRIVIVVQNGAFDLAVMAAYAAVTHGVDLLPKIFTAYHAGRIFDIQEAAKLHAIATGHLGMDPRTGGKLRDPVDRKETASYRLSVIVDLYLGRINAKANDRWRLRYHELDGIPLDQWPLDAQTYPVDDAKNTLECALAMIGAWQRAGVHRWGPGPRCLQCGTTDTMQRVCWHTAANLNLHEVSRQSFSAFCLHLGGIWGFAVDPAAVAALERTTWLHDENGVPTPRWHTRQRFVEAGIIRGGDVKGKKEGSEDQSLLKRLVAEAYGATAPCPTCRGTGKVPSEKTGKPVICKECDGTTYDMSKVPVPETDTGGVGKGRDVLYESGNELLMAYAAFKLDAKIETTYLPWLRKGLGRPLTLYANNLLETGRTSYGDVVQLCPREGGVRECVVARPGKVLGSCDWEAAELIGHAQSCLWLVGRSVLAEQLLAKKKPHNALGARVLGISYDEFNRRLEAGDKTCANSRQAAKPFNFGKPGRMGSWKIVLQQRKQGPDTPHPSGPIEISKGVRGYKGLRFCLLMSGTERCGATMVTEWRKRTGPPTCLDCLKAAERLSKDWITEYPENESYFKIVQKHEDGNIPVIQHVYRRIRGGATGNAIANGWFQGLIADAIKDAIILISTECYAVPQSPLYGSRMILAAHDETIVEYPEAIAHEASLRTDELQEFALKRLCPDLAPAVSAESALMRRWLKGAKTVVDANGRRVAYEPKRKAAA